jgi:Bacterial alpha-L-rhamnosidase 6 hairpin glycosidase domain/Carbohydrate binding module (family 6)
MRKHRFLIPVLLLSMAFAGIFLHGILTPAAALQASSISHPWDVYNYSPSSRTIAPVAIYTVTGAVSNPNNILSGSATRISGYGSSITLDFGKEVAGIITLSAAGSSDAKQSVGLTFSESSNNIGASSDASTGSDSAVIASITGAGTFTMPASSLRGGFRYFTLFLNSTGWVDLKGVSLNFTAAPTMSNPSQYANYFYSSDELLNKLWYAGAYTVQLDSIDPTQGRDNSTTVGSGSTVLVDGAKRDRVVWPGDMGISVPTAYVSTGDLLSSKNSLTTLYSVQNTTGELPYAGPPWLGDSDTYHMWTLVGTYNYYLYSGDKTWLDGIWSKYKLGVTYMTNKVDSNGLLNVTNANDWARGDQGGENIEANAILYRVLTTGAIMAQAEGDSSTATNYTNQAASLKTQINARLWDANAGAYEDNPGNTSLHPQDGNSLAVWFNVVDTNAKAQSIMTNLTGNWNSYGSHTPEWGNISPFVGSMELYARFAANDDANAISLMKLEWGYMLNATIGNNSTFWEGVKDDGTFAYGTSFTSLAHGWSTGPTGTLTMDVLGIAPDTIQGKTYHIVPHPGDLAHVEGNLTVASGKVLSANYTRGAAGNVTLQVDSSTNSGSVGVIAVPKFGQNHVVQVNNTTAWNGSSFLGASGISSADQDANYIYFRGVQPGTYTLSYPATVAMSYEAETTNNTLGGAARDVSCSGCSGGGRVGYIGNGGTLQFNDVNVGVAGPYQLAITYTNADAGTRTVALSVDGEAATTISGFTSTSNANTTNTVTTTVNLNAGGNTLMFSNGGNWAPDIDKITLTSNAVPPSIGSGWVPCANENQLCVFSGTAAVAYGANGQFAYGNFTNGAICNNGVFTDPIVGTVKGCFYSTSFVAPTPGVWVSCANENGTCSFTGTMEVAFGASGHYSYGSFTNGTACNISVFPDPDKGVVKNCFDQAPSA